MVSLFLISAKYFGFDVFRCLFVFSSIFWKHLESWGEGVSRGLESQRHLLKVQTQRELSQHPGEHANHKGGEKRGKL